MSTHAIQPGDDDLRSAVAVPTSGTAVLVTTRRGPRGPWSIIADVPTEGREPAGPPPGYLALTGIASCTIVTVAGVASRGRSPLLDMRVSFDVSPRAEGGFDIRQRTVLTADLSDTDYGRLSRAVGFCPIGKIFSKRAIAIDDRVELRGARTGAAPARAPAAGDPPVFLPGSASAQWLASTGEWREADGRRSLDQEGEVVVHVDCASESGRRRWGLLGGHTSAGWAPRPSAYAMAGLASSTLMTLRARADALGIDPTTLRVEVRSLSPVPSGGKRQSQEDAAVGEAKPVRWLREVTVEAASSAAATEAILSAMRLDPIYGHCMRGDLLAGEEIVVVTP